MAVEIATSSPCPTRRLDLSRTSSPIPPRPPPALSHRRDTVNGTEPYSQSNPSPQGYPQLNTSAQSHSPINASLQGHPQLNASAQNPSQFNVSAQGHPQLNASQSVTQSQIDPQARVPRLISALARTSSLPVQQSPLRPLTDRTNSPLHHSSSSSSSPVHSTNTSPDPSPLKKNAPFAEETLHSAPLSLHFGPSIIAQGGGGATKLRTAIDLGTGKLLGLKSVSSTTLPREMRQLEREHEALQALRGCTNVVQLISFENLAEVEGGASAKRLVLEYVSGGSVADLMVRFGGGGLPEQLVRRYTRGILQGLASVHSKGIVHCDLRARSVLLCDTTGVPKLCSFGLALWKGEAGERKARKQRLQGSYQWMAPEVIRQEDQTSSSDIWSFGCTVLEILKGSAPWAGQVEVAGASCLADVIGRSQDLPAFPESLSPECRKFLRRCLQRDPAARPTALQLLQDPFLQSPSPPKERAAPLPGIPRPSLGRTTVNRASPLGQEKLGGSSSPLQGSHSAEGGVGVSRAALRTAQQGSVSLRENAKGSNVPFPLGNAVSGAANEVLPLGGSSLPERPKSPGGHHGICKVTFQKAALARAQSGVPAGTADIWRRDGEETGGVRSNVTAGSGDCQIWQRDDNRVPLARTSSLQSYHQTASASASAAAAAAAATAASAVATAAGGGGSAAGGGGGGGSGGGGIALGHAHASVVMTPAAVATPPAVPPAVAQLLNSANGIKMGPLMRQISKEASEFARLQREVSTGGTTISPSGDNFSSPLGKPAVPSAATSKTAVPSMTAVPSKPSSSSQFLPAAPLSPKTSSPLQQSPRNKCHRQSSTSPVEPESAAHSRSGPVQGETLLSSENRVSQQRIGLENRETLFSADHRSLSSPGSPSLTGSPLIGSPMSASPLIGSPTSNGSPSGDGYNKSTRMQSCLRRSSSSIPSE